MNRLLLRPFATIFSVRPTPTYKLVINPQSPMIFKFSEIKNRSSEMDKQNQRTGLNSAQRQKQENQKRD